MPPEITQLLAGASVLTIVGVCGSIVLSLAVTIGVTLLVIRFVRKTVGQDRTVVENGIPARAKILSLRQTGVMLNNQPQVEFQLEVHPPSGMPYHAQAKAVIALVSIPQFQPGAEVAVKIHPTDQTKVVIVPQG
jgi:hypothetical protein